jgi:hypothetical protein
VFTTPSDLWATFAVARPHRKAYNVRATDRQVDDDLSRQKVVNTLGSPARRGPHCVEVGALSKLRQSSPSGPAEIAVEPTRSENVNDGRTALDQVIF